MARQQMTQAERDTRRARELSELSGLIEHVKSGGADHMFADAETKTVFLADLDAQVIALVNAEVDANPDIYKRYPEGKVGLTDSERKVMPLSR